MDRLDIVNWILDELGRGGAVELAVVVDARGSAPRAAGAWMALRADGSAAGTVGGGSVEAIALKEAACLLDARESRSARYSLGGAQSDTGMVCGGDVRLCYAHLDASCAEVLERMRGILERRGEGVLEIDLAPFGACDDGAHGAASARTVAGPLPLAIRFPPDRQGIAAGMDGTRYREPVSPEGHVYLFGCGHVGRALVPVLARAGFSVIACDDRPEMLSADLLPDAADRRLVDYGDLSATCSIGPRDLVVTATSHHAGDRSVVEQALAAHPSYLGCLGSKKKVGYVRAQLIEAGFAPEEADAVHMPIGLPIEAETPEEIAISIAAEMVRHRRTVIQPRRR